MNLNDISIATITLARNKNEEQELVHALEQLASLQLPVIVTDGGSIEAFIKFLSGVKQFTVLHKNAGGLIGQINSSLLEAYKSDRPFIFYTEPDKKEFFQNHLLTLLQSINPTNETGVVVAARSASGFASFPSFQQMTETTINNCCQEMLNYKTDYCYGPFLMNKKLVPHLSALKEDVGWGWRPFIFNKAKQSGLAIASVSGDFLCPVQQREEDEKERIHRMKQLEQNIRGLVLSTQEDISQK